MDRQNRFSNPSFNSAGRGSQITAAILLAITLLLAPGCATQATFDSADMAVDSFVAAARAGDNAQLKNMLGPGSEDILSSGDPVADKNMLKDFVKAYDEKHQLVAGPEKSMTLTIGKSDWPMPIPIVSDGGKWRFDTQAGKEEILNRRIGRNELSTIQACLAILDAQREYASIDRNADGLCEYATCFISEPDKKNGLFWLTKEGEPQSPLGPVFAQAAEEGYQVAGPRGGVPRTFHGYRFRMLTQQGANAPGGEIDYMVGGKLVGGFAVVAWPADYGNSGIMTFIMNHEGKVYQRDLGNDTNKTAASMKDYDPSPEWKSEGSALNK